MKDSFVIPWAQSWNLYCSQMYKNIKAIEKTKKNAVEIIKIFIIGFVHFIWFRNCIPILLPFPLIANTEHIFFYKLKLRMEKEAFFI